MNDAVKKLWIADLRSGKHKQTQGVLRNEIDADDDYFCCLGRLCDIAPMGKWLNTLFISEDTPHSETCDTMPPDNVLEWAELDYNDAENLASMNDGGHSFAEIADHIEENL